VCKNPQPNKPNPGRDWVTDFQEKWSDVLKIDRMSILEGIRAKARCRRVFSPFYE
jgi:hypothetical protein